MLKHSPAAHAAILAILAASLLAAAPTAIAQAWPNRPVKILVGFPAGQATDVLARLAAQRLSDTTGQQFYVENRPGAGARTGTGGAHRPRRP